MPHEEYDDEYRRMRIANVIQFHAPKALVLPWWTLDEDRTRWPAGMLSPLDRDEKGRARVHGYAILREDTAGVFFGNCGVLREYSYGILALRYYDPTAGEETNSERLFLKEIDAIVKQFDDTASLDEAIRSLKEPLRFATKVSPKDFGQILHVGIGTLRLEPC